MTIANQHQVNRFVFFGLKATNDAVPGSNRRSDTRFLAWKKVILRITMKDIMSNVTLVEHSICVHHIAIRKAIRFAGRITQYTDQ